MPRTDLLRMMMVWKLHTPTEDPHSLHRSTTTQISIRKVELVDVDGAFESNIVSDGVLMRSSSSILGKLKASLCDLTPSDRMISTKPMVMESCYGVIKSVEKKDPSDAKVTKPAAKK